MDAPASGSRHAFACIFRSQAGIIGMELKLYDTLTREKRLFTPIDPLRARMYVCGPTVYDFAHIGNARPEIVFDVLFRLLRHLAKQGVWDGGKGRTTVTYVRNITDVDDKINARAAEEYPDLPLNEAIRKVTEQTDRQFHQDVAALGCLPPTVEPRATEHIAEMRVLIERLVESGNAYVAEGNVLFSVSSMSDYGRLSKRPLDEMIAGARVDVAPYKRDPMDFVLWKPSKSGEPAWPSPCGIAATGRPGWHIECSAMSWKHLGEVFDIHGGGIDLVFPHHENEIAQSRCAFHAPAMANYWMHNGFLQVEGEKMSKSLGNFVTIHELLADWPGEVIRLNMLRTHYRQPIDWTMRGLEESEKTIDHWYEIVGDTALDADAGPDPDVLQTLCDDLNTPAALTRLHAIASEIRGLASGLHQIEPKRRFKASAELLGLLETTCGVYVSRHPRRKQVDTTTINALVEARTRARAAKNFAESDRIRNELAAMGVMLKDSKDGTTWEIAR
jgi:cysteinyl-tRNA synthetase